MALYFILENAPSIEADSPKKAVELYSQQKNIVGGTVTVSTKNKVFSITQNPPTVEATEEPTENP